MPNYIEGLEGSKAAPECEPSDIELGITALGGEYWDDAEAEAEVSRDDRVRFDYGVGEEDDRDEGKQDAEDEAD